MTAAIPDFEHFPTLYYFTTSIHYKQYKKKTPQVCLWSRKLTSYVE